MSMDQPADRRPEWLRRKHGKQRSEPYAELLAGAPRCTAAEDGDHQRSVVIRTVHDLDGNEHPIADEDEARNVVNALYRSRPRDGGSFLVSIPKPERVQLGDGTWEVRCCVHDKAHGDAYMAANPGRKVYDPAAKTAQAATQRPARRRRPTKAAQRAREEAEAGKLSYASALASTPLGAPTADIRIWALDHGHREPVTAEERQRRDAATVARLKAQQQARRQAKAQRQDGQVSPATRLRDWWMPSR
jgi:hypothetical protein